MFSFFKKLSVDAVLSTFRKAIEDLKTVEANNEDAHLQHKADAQASTVQAAMHARECDRARAIRAKIENLLA